MGVIEIIVLVLKILLPIVTAILGASAAKKILAKKAREREKVAEASAKAKIAQLRADLKARELARKAQKELALHPEREANLLFKLPKYEKEFYNAPPRLQEIVQEFALLARKGGIAATVTRVRDHVEGSSGVHKLNRAVDVRDEFKGEFTFPQPLRDELIEFINAKYPYGDKYKTCVWHSFDSGPHHFHFQVSSEWVS